ncbi:hypothetical protein GCM10023093_01500 [Nemorincola caseinilytica]|uniref:Nucleotidyl transferase AbiEii toxin, Type IV TA system n=2 Tax=Nemorincola caseinilytica TaxID=2054315 RepID=A0ABP8N4Q1_9BACT
MQDRALGQFFLVGGTALSLQIGHRISIDIDLFSITAFEENKLAEYLGSEYGLRLAYLDKNTIKGQVDNVQVDLITHAYPLVKDAASVDGVRMAGLEDIAAMKLNAIIGNGTRLKDFIDIAFLSQYLSLEDMTDAYEKKYNIRNAVMTLKALAWHNDINFDEPISYVHRACSWKHIEARLAQMIRYPERTFHGPPGS